MTPTSHHISSRILAICIFYLLAFAGVLFPSLLAVEGCADSAQLGSQFAGKEGLSAAGRLSLPTMLASRQSPRFLCFFRPASSRHRLASLPASSVGLSTWCRPLKEWTSTARGSYAGHPGPRPSLLALAGPATIPAVQGVGKASVPLPSALEPIRRALAAAWLQPGQPFSFVFLIACHRCCFLREQPPSAPPGVMGAISPFAAWAPRFCFVLLHREMSRGRSTHAARGRRRRV